jgi:hypothetical protein
MKDVKGFLVLHKYTTLNAVVILSGAVMCWMSGLLYYYITVVLLLALGLYCFTKKGDD